MTDADIREFLDHIAKVGLPGHPPARDPLTIKRAWEIYQAANSTRVRSLNSDSGRIRHVLDFFGDEQDAASLTLEDVDRYRQHRRGELTVRKAPPSTKTLNNEIEILTRILSFALSRKLLAANPLAAVDYEPEDNVRQVVVKEDLLGQILSACSPWLRAFVLLAIDSGMRRTEIVRLRWSQVDERLGLIELAAADTKTRRARTTILSARAARAVSALPRSETWLFVNPETGRPFHPDYATDYFQKTLLRAGIVAADGRAIWLHDLRRSFVTNSRRSGVSETDIMAMTGHRTSSVFARYNVRGREDVLRARKLLGASHRAGRRVSHPKAAPNARGAV